MDLLAIRQHVRTWYSYVCFDLENLCRELSDSGLDERDIQTELNARMEQLLAEDTGELRDVIIQSGGVEVEANEFVAGQMMLFRGLLVWLIDMWIAAL